VGCHSAQLCRRTSTKDKEASEVDAADSRRALHVDLAALKSYGADVHAATDAYLATLSDGDLDRKADLSAGGFGTQKLGWMLNLLLLNHLGTETGEIAVLKGIQARRAIRCEYQRRLTTPALGSRPPGSREGHALIRRLRINLYQWVRFDEGRLRTSGR
jgi:hypothetical protein